MLPAASFLSYRRFRSSCDCRSVNRDFWSAPYCNCYWKLKIQKLLSQIFHKYPEHTCDKSMSLSFVRYISKNVEFIFENNMHMLTNPVLILFFCPSQMLGPTWHFIMEFSSWSLGNLCTDHSCRQTAWIQRMTLCDWPQTAGFFICDEDGNGKVLLVWEVDFLRAKIIALLKRGPKGVIFASFLISKTAFAENVPH